MKRPEIEKKLFKQREVPIIETSADDNVNISETFQVIASLVDKRRNNKESRKSVEVKPFRQAREEVFRNGARINDDFKEFLKENLVQYETTYRAGLGNLCIKNRLWDRFFSPELESRQVSLDRRFSGL